MARATKPPAAKGRAAEPAADPPVKVRRTVGKDKTVKITVETPPPAPGATAGPPPGLDDAARLVDRVRADLLETVRELRGAVAEVRTFRDERDALVRELASLRQEVGAARKDAADALGHLHA
ncbi:MAG: hypothetical protein K2X87_26430, partial [Gemmataceae bacterium]|nr:hypothetical protein [Gemmataceae bacterium]